MTVASDIEQIKIQEQTLRFKSCSEQAVWDLGCQMRQAAIAQNLPLVIDISIGDRQMFYSALAGTSADNAHWVRRKANSVRRFEKSTYRLNRETDGSNKPFGAVSGIDLLQFSNHGGGFPLHIVGTGVVGAITVSGIPQRDDHGFVIEQLCQFLKFDHRAFMLGPEDK